MALDNTTAMLIAISVLLGIMVIDCAFDVPAFAALGWQLAPSQTELVTARAAPAILQMQGYYAHVTQVFFVEMAIITAIVTLALGATYRVAFVAGASSWVLLVGLLVAAPYFIFIMGPSEKAIGSATSNEVMVHVLNILRGRVLIVALCVWAFILLATAPLSSNPSPDKKKKKKRQ